eukprot:GHVS01047946.1.p1 GENE.GHVS01047946.1~~GHVS01047946.1.p1  ORF type:complete len:369 (-),score=87.06 GHVS01047946.1:1317-2423(-)
MSDSDNIPVTVTSSTDDKAPPTLLRPNPPPPPVDDDRFTQPPSSFPHDGSWRTSGPIPVCHHHLPDHRRCPRSDLPSECTPPRFTPHHHNSFPCPSHSCMRSPPPPMYHTAAAQFGPTSSCGFDNRMAVPPTGRRCYHTDYHHPHHPHHQHNQLPVPPPSPYPSTRDACIDLPTLLGQAKFTSPNAPPAPQFHAPESMHMRSVPPHLAPHMPLSVFPSTANDHHGGVPTAAAVLRHLPRVDVLGDTVKYIVEIELPGVEKKDVKVQLDEGRVITVSALHLLDEQLERELQQRQQEQQKEQKEEACGEQTKEEPMEWHVMERRRGMFERTLKMPPNVDVDNLEAKFENGLLRITAPKIQPHVSISIPVL